MSTRIVKIFFSGPVHFGQGRLSDGAYACDAATLFSALYLEALKAGSADALLNAVNRGECQISDAFPFIGEDLYLPKPMASPASSLPDETSASDSRIKKAHKKLSYIPARSFKGFLRGDFDAIQELRIFEQGIGRSFLQTKVNLVREDDEDALPYYVGGFSFNPSAGIYFIVKGSFDLEFLLDGLQYSGLGGKRSSGYGRFTYKIFDERMLNGVRLGDAGSRHLLLSTSAPTEAELSDSLIKGAQYKLIRRGGFVQSSSHAATAQKKRDMYLFESGSVFGRTFIGKVFDVNETPGAHPVFRYARALWMEV